MPRIKEIFPIAILVAVQFVLAAGLRVQLGNRPEFEFGPLAVLPTLVGIALAVTAVLTGVGALLPAAARSRYAAFLFGIGVLGWLQSAFWAAGYGQFTGADIDWTLFKVRGWLDLALWVAVLVACVRYHHRIVSRARFLAPLLAGLILVGVGVYGVTTRDEAPPVSDGPDPSTLARFSQGRNVVHVLMDGFQTGTFLELVDEEGLADRLGGFTVFRDNTAVAAYTAMSMPAIFSGDVFDGSETPAQYHHRALRKGGFHHRLHEEGYAVHLIPKIPMNGEGYTLYAETPHVYGLPRKERIRKQAMYLVDLGLFTSSPHFLRRAIHDRGNWLISGSAGAERKGLNTYQRAFFREYVAQLEVVRDEPAYHFIHLLPPHDPFVTLPDGTDAGRVLPATHANYRIEAWETLKLFLNLLDRLRDEGLYDDALIVLHADHGIGRLGMNAGDDRQLAVPRAPTLLAVKPLGAQGPLGVSDAPTTVADIPATILDGLGLEHDHAGKSVFAIPEDEPRPRPFNSYTLGAKSRGTITRFEVDGSIYDPGSWRELAPRPVNLGRPEYAWGTPVTFGVGSDCDRYLGPDWSSGGAGGCRINLEKKATVTLLTDPTAEAVRATFTFRPRQREGEQRELGMRLVCNGQKVGEQRFLRPEPQEFTFLIPAGQATGGRLRLEFEFTEHSGARSSLRQAICLMAMVVEPVTAD